MRHKYLWFVGILIFTTSVAAQVPALDPAQTPEPITVPPTAAAPALPPGSTPLPPPRPVSVYAPPVATAPAVPAPVQVSESSDWFAGWPNSGNYSQYLGFESASVGTSPIGQNSIVYGRWHGNTGYQIIAGFTKVRDTLQTSTTSSSDVINNTSTSTTSYSGAKNPLTLNVGGAWMRKIHQSKWLQVSGGPFGGLIYATNTSYPVGSISTAMSNVTGNQSITETGYGVSQTQTDLGAYVGFKAATEFYVKWFPNLALGFGTGIVTNFVGKTRTLSDSTSMSQSITSGVSTISSRVNSSSKAENDPGLGFSTFAVGGMVFQLTGTFTIHYVW